MKKEFLSQNFQAFIKDNEEFFVKYKKIFVKNFSDYLGKISVKKLMVPMQMIIDFYDALFINPFFTKSKLNNELAVIYKLNDYNIDITQILNRLFLIMANHYIKYLIKEKNPNS